MRKLITSFIALSCLVVSAGAQPLADRVPENSILYVGWCGSESMPSEYQASHLKAVLDVSNLPEVFNEMLPQVIAKAAIQNREVAEVYDYFKGIAGPMWRHPTAIYFTGIDFTGPEPMPRVGLICEAGKDLQGMVDRLTALKQKAGGNAPINWQVDNTTLTVFVGAKPEPVGNGLAASATFKSALAKVKSSAACAFYVDGAKAIALVDDVVQKSNDPNAMQYWPRVRESTGIGGLTSIIWTSGFDGKEWGDQLFVGAPAPRRGLLAWGDSPPVPDALLKTVPATATNVSVGAFDPAAAVESLRAIVGTVEPKALPPFNQGIGIANTVLGMDLIKDVLEPLGPHWAVYTDPNIAGIGLLGLVIVNRPDDPAKAEKALNQIGGVIASASGQAMRNEGMSIPFRITKVGDLSVNYIGSPLVSPAWTVKDGNLYIALFPQVAASAARSAASGKASILENADFQAMRKRLGQANATSLSYSDLRKGATESYQILLALSRLGLGMADMWGVKSPELVMPPLDDLIKHLSPTGSVTWADNDGYHLKKVSPFPGSEIVGGGAGIIAPIIGSSALMSGLALPSMGRARESANRVKCASNMRQMGMAMIMFSEKNGGKLPATMGDLLKQEITVDVFVCPAHNNEIPANLRRADLAAKMAWVNENADYVYLGAGKTHATAADTVLLYEKFENHGGDGINLLFGDGHVEFQRMNNALRELERSGAAAPQ